MSFANAVRGLAPLSPVHPVTTPRPALPYILTQQAQSAVELGKQRMDADRATAAASKRFLRSTEPCAG
jgi:hypothetical protein